MDLEQFLTAKDREVLAKAGYGREITLGKRPALLVVDVTYEFTGKENEPLLDAVEKICTACGEVAWGAIKHMEKIIASVRENKIPIIYTCADRSIEVGPFVKKNKRLADRDPALCQIVTEIAPIQGEPIIKKIAPSAFFGTNLLYLLISQGIDSLIVVGGVTSGCVRATVVDAFSYGYKVLVAQEGVFDRSQASNAINLLDIRAKYGNLSTTEEVLNYIEECRQT